MATAPTTLTSTRVPARAIPALVAVLAGIGLFLTAGFAWPEAIHNATHDTRHALGLPCH